MHGGEWHQGGKRAGARHLDNNKECAVAYGDLERSAWRMGVTCASCSDSRLRGIFSRAI